MVALTIYFFFILDLHLQGYVTIVTLVMAILLFAGRNFLGKWLEHIFVGYLLCIIAMVVFNLSSVVLSLGSCQAFYAGYAFALIQRIFGYRVVNIYSMIIFHIICLGLRLAFLSDEQVLSVSLAVAVVEIFTMCLTLKSEIGDRSLFDSLYRSKQQLLKFKDFITQHLPNQMVIFAKDNSRTFFMNDAFKKTFRCKKISQAQNALSRLTLERGSIKKLSMLAADLASSEEEGHSINLLQILSMLSKSNTLIKGQESLSLQVYESEITQEFSGTQGIGSIRDSSGEEEEPVSQAAKRYGLKNSGKLTAKFISKKAQTSKIIQSQPCLIPLAKSCEFTKSEILGLEKKPDIAIHPPEEQRKSFKVKIFSLPWDGKDAIAVVLDDITQQKTIMELQIADRNKDLVIAMVSHELRTPLNGMLGLLDIAKKKISDVEVTSYLNACRNSGFFLLNLVNSILDLSQIKNNKLKLVYTKVSLGQLLEEVKSLFESFCATKNLYLNIEMQEDIPKIITTDRSRLGQVLINLLGNAFKFTFVGGVTLRVEVEQKSPLRLRFYVQDTGLGIKKEDQEKLFKLFGRLEQQDKSVNTNGVGLGLTISNTLAILLNPSENQGIHVESELGKGSTFSFLVECEVENISTNIGKPTVRNSIRYDQSLDSFDDEFFSLASKMGSYKTSGAFKFNHMRSSQKSPTLLEQSSSIEAIPFTRKQSKHLSSSLPTGGKSLKNFLEDKINNISKPDNYMLQLDSPERVEKKSWCLIVDDNPFNIMVARHIMEEKEYQVKTALNGKEAIQEVKSHHKVGKTFRIVLMDCQMPVMDGYEATRLMKIMMKTGEIKEFPIIALTANNQDEEHERRCQEAGMNGSISKPLHIGELDNILKNISKDMLR